MAAAIPTQEPTEFRAGETVQWTKSVPDYTYADGWRLTYYLRGPVPLSIATTADTDGRGFAVTIDAATTAALQPGSYWLEGRVVLAGASYSIGPRISITILPDFTSEEQTGAAFDGRSHARKCRDALRAIIEGTAGNLVINYTIFGERNVQLMSVAERLELLNYYESRVAEEEKRDAINRGERTGVYIRFRSGR